MSAELTRDSRKALKHVYDLYTERRKAGQPKATAKSFDAPGWGGGPKIDGMDNAEDELRDAGFIKTDILGGFELTDKAIIFMENFNKETALKWIEFGAQFIP